jgi:hypothetical protein
MPSRRLRDENGLGTTRAVNLRAGVTLVTLNRLAALRAGKSEFGHRVMILKDFCALTYIIMSLHVSPFKSLFGCY